MTHPWNRFSPGALATTHWEVVRVPEAPFTTGPLEPLFVSTKTGTAGENECFAWLLRHQGQSVHYATTYGGYRIRPFLAKETPA